MNKVYTVISDYFWAGGREIPRGTNFIFQDNTEHDTGYGLGLVMLHPTTGNFIGIYWTNCYSTVEYFIKSKRIKEINAFDEEML